MRLWKAWSETRQKFVLSFVLVTLLMAPVMVTAALDASKAGSPESGVGEGGLPASDAFSSELGTWMGGNLYYTFAVLAVVLAVGGILSLGNSRSNLMTLSLPGRRSSWLWAQSWVCALLVLGLCAWEAMIMMVTGWVAGLDVPEGRLAMAVLLTSFTGALWIWPAILGTALTRDGVQAALVVVSVVVLLEVVSEAFGQAPVGFTSLASVTQWQLAVPWRPLLLGLALTSLCAVLAQARFRRMEF